MKNKQQKIVAVICVRMGSNRLPNKVMLKILGKPILGHLIERVTRAKSIDEIVVATSCNPDNNAIEDYCRKENISCFRGSEEDVLGRTLGALKTCKADVAVEIFGDCPLIDPVIIDDIVKYYLDNVHKYDFVSNDLKTTFPPGTEVEVYSVKVLEDASKRAVSNKIREHGTLYMRQHPELYRLHNVEAPLELCYPDKAIELDTEEDFAVIKAIFENLYPIKPDFALHDIINFLQRNPEVTAINKNVHRRWRDFRKDEI